MKTLFDGSPVPLSLNLIWLDTAAKEIDRNLKANAPVSVAAYSNVAQAAGLPASKERVALIANLFERNVDNSFGHGQPLGSRRAISADEKSAVKAFVQALRKVSESR